ncbi:cTAGE family member 5 isoform X2 [Chiloscyllium punctatum]|uniref:cTAGE family member 5 isoform X2 n=1 Tax=Chiloscyllium punctatum TaxID=137246 RepID=UPI003B63B882
MAQSAAFTILVLLLLQFIPYHKCSKLSDLKICGDPECERYLSRVKATVDYIGYDCRFLTFKSGDSIFVYFKLTGKKDELWAGSIGKQFGYFPKDAVQVEDVLVSTEIELPTKESDFLCLDGGDYYIESEETDSVSDEYGENSNSEEIRSILGHESESNINSQDYKGNSAKDELVDNLINLYKEQFQRTHHAADDAVLKMTPSNEQIEPSLATDVTGQVNEFHSPADNLNQLNEASASKHTDNNELKSETGPESVYSEHIAPESELSGQEIREKPAITSESNEESKFLQEASSWIGSRISGWFGSKNDLDKKPVEQINSFKSRKIALGDAEDTPASEAMDDQINEHFKDKENLGSETSSWIGDLSKLFSFTRDSPEDALSSDDGDKSREELENINSFSVDDSTVPSKSEIPNLENKMPDLSVPSEIKLQSSSSEKVSKDTGRATHNLMDNDQLIFNDTNKAWAGQTGTAENSGISKETENVGVKNPTDKDGSKTWWFDFNTARKTFRFNENNGEQTSKTSEGTQDSAVNKDSIRGTDRSKPSPWYHFGLSETFGFSQGNEDQLASNLQEETKKCITESNKNTMNSESEVCSPILVVDQAPREREALIADSLINEEPIHYPEINLCKMENDINCLSEGLQQTAKEPGVIKSENTQKVHSTNSLENSFRFDGTASNLKDIWKLEVQNLQEQNSMMDSKLVGDNKPLTQESIHKEQYLQEHLKIHSVVKQSNSDYMRSMTHKDLQTKETSHSKHNFLHSHDLISSIGEFGVESKDQALEFGLQKEEQHLTLDPELPPTGDRSSERIVTNSAKPSALDKLQAEETLQHNLVSESESNLLLSNAANSMSQNTLQNKDNFSQENKLIKSDSQQITVTDRDQYQEKELPHEQLISQQQHIESTMELEQLGISDENKLLSHTRTFNEQQTLNSEFDELTTSGQDIPSSQNELGNKECITEGKHITSAKQEILDNYNPLSQNEKQALEERHPSSLVDKKITVINTYGASLKEQMCDEAQRVLSLQPASDPTHTLPQEEFYSGSNTLQQQAPVSDSESSQFTSDHGEAELQHCLHEEEHVFKECLPVKPESTQAAPDIEKSLLLKKCDGQDLQEFQISCTSEFNWLSVSDHSKNALSEKLHVHEEILQASILTLQQSEKHTDSDKDRLLLNEKMNDKHHALQTQCIISDLSLKPLTTIDNTESLLQDKKQTLSDQLSSSQVEELTVSNDGKTLKQENPFHQQNNMGDKITLESGEQSVVLHSTEDLSQEETEVTKVNSNTTLHSEKRNKMHKTNVELVNSLLSENMNLTGVSFSRVEDTDTKVEPQLIIKETRTVETNVNHREIKNTISEKATQPLIDPITPNLWEEKTLSDSEELSDISTPKSLYTSQLSTTVMPNPDGANENINPAISASAENEHRTRHVTDEEITIVRDVEFSDDQTSSSSFWGRQSPLEEINKPFEKLRVRHTSSDILNLNSNLKLLKKQMGIAHLQHLERCFDKTKLLWLEEILEQLENENCNNGFHNILQKVNTFEDSFWQNKDFTCDKNDANIEYIMIEKQHDEDTGMFQKLQDILTAIKMKCTSNISSSSTIEDAFSSGDILKAGVTNNEPISENGQTNKDIQEQKTAKDITSEVTETPTLEMPLLNLSEKIPDLEKAAVKTMMETKLGNQIQKKSHDIKTEERIYDKIEEKMASSSLNKDFEVKKSSGIINSKIKVASENNNEYKPSVKNIDFHKVASVFDLDFQAIQIATDQFINNFYLKVMDALSEDAETILNLQGTYTELFLIPALVGFVTTLLFIQRICQAIKSRRYFGREKQLAGTVSQLLDEKCKFLERLSDCTQKYKEFESSIKNAADLKESTETTTLQLQDAYAKLDKSNGNLRQTIDQLTQDLEEEKQTRSQCSNLITEIRANLTTLENEAQNLQVQIEETTNELKAIQINNSKHQESFQTAQEENYHLKQSKEQLLQESEGWEERYSERSEQIKLCEKTQKDIRRVFASKENEVKTLTSCLLKMKLWNVPEEESPTEEMSEEQQKEKIEKLIYFAKLNADLKSAEDERNQIYSKLSDEIKAKQELTERIEKLQLEHTSVQNETTQFETEYKTIQQKLKIMTELYHEKEMELQRNLTLEEHQRLQKEEKLSEVDEKINQATEELSIYRQRAKDLEEELVKTIQSYKNQIVSHEKKAHDNWLSAREADRELGNIKRENIHLRQKITEAEFKMDIAMKGPLVNDTSGRPALLSSSTLVPPYRGSSPYGSSPVGRPGSDSVGFLSPPLIDGPLRFSPLFPGRPDFKTQGPSVHASNENADSVSDQLSDHHGPQSDSGSLSPVWEREQKFLETPSGECSTLESSMEISNSAPGNQTQVHGTSSISINQTIPTQPDFGVRPGFAAASAKQIPSLPFDPRGHFLPRGIPLRPRGGIYGLPERIPLRAFGLPPHPAMGMRDPVQAGVNHLPLPQPTFLPPRQLLDVPSGLLPSRQPVPKFSAPEHPSQEK